LMRRGRPRPRHRFPRLQASTLSCSRSLLAQNRCSPGSNGTTGASRAWPACLL
jgi:hypothetical protein